jgi:hypothetical protein
VSLRFAYLAVLRVFGWLALLALWVPKTFATWAYAQRNAAGLGSASGVGRAGLGPSGGGMICGLWA